MAVAHYKKNAQKGDPEAMANLCFMYEMGAGVELDYKRAEIWDGQAAEKGHARAQSNLGWIYIRGLGLHADPKTGMALIQEAAQQSNARAQNNFGSMHRIPTKTIHFHNLTAAQGYPVAQFNRATWYMGKGDGHDHNKARELFLLTANQMHIGAQMRLAKIYHSRHGVPENPHKALHWYLRAAKQGDVWAQSMVGWMYFVGQKTSGIPQDYKKAEKWNLLAANQGDMVAQELLGFL